MQNTTNSNQSNTILQLHKYFLAKRSERHYNNINKGAFDLNEE